MSRCQTSAYSHQPFSQSQKVSIGIVVDSLAPQPTKVAENKEASTSKRSTLKRNDQRKDLQASSRAMVSSLRGVQPVHSAQTARNEGHGVSRKVDAESSFQREGKVSGVDERSENVSCVPKQACGSVKEAVQEQTVGADTISKEALRLKLRQILGINTSPDGKVDGKVDYEKTPDVNSHEMVQEQNANDDPPYNPWQNSDTIEADSEIGSLTTKRPITRSRAKKKAPTGGQTRKLKPKSFSCDKVAEKDNSISSYARKSVPPQSCVVNRGGSAAKRTDSANNRYGIKPGDLLSPITNLKNIQSVMTEGEKLPSVKETPLRSVAKSRLPQGGSNENIEAMMHDVNLNNSPVVSKMHQSGSENLVLTKKLEHCESFGFQRPAPQDDGSENPSFKLKKDVLNSPISLFPVNKDKQQHMHGSPRRAGQSINKDICLSTSSSSLANDSDSSDGTYTPHDRHANCKDSSAEDTDADERLFTPGRDESDSTEEASSMNRACGEDVQTPLEFGLAEKPMFSNKRRRSQVADLEDFSPVLTAPKAGETDDMVMEASDGNADDELARVISLLGLALQKVKSKMALATNKRCLDLLMSGAEEILSQLQDVESQIQTDLGKLTSQRISKRKHLETKLHEQQEHLKLIHEKFKEDICKYIQDCRGAVEGLEAQHAELKGAIETQKASHRKLVLEAEAAVENHIVNTERKVMSVHKVGKMKMQQLKVAIGECLRDVISS